MEVPHTAPQTVATVCGQHGPLHIGNVSLGGQQIAPGAGAVQGAGGIKHIHQAEGQGGGSNQKGQLRRIVVGQAGGKVKALCKDPAKRRGSKLPEGRKGIQIERCTEVCIKPRNRDPQKVLQNGAAQDSPQNSAPCAPVCHKG